MCLFAFFQSLSPEMLLLFFLLTFFSLPANEGDEVDCGNVMEAGGDGVVELELKADDGAEVESDGVEFELE